MANAFEPDWEESNELDGYRNRRAPVGRQAGARRLGASVFELGPGQAAFPLHYHLANEEMLFVLQGSPSLRTPERERTLEPGEVVALPVGERGAHQVVNRSREPARILIASQMVAPELVIRPESEKLSALGRAPGARGEGIHKVFFDRDSTPFWEGEAPPPEQR
jgi:uncharacterized cupin superfamily protein